MMLANYRRLAAAAPAAPTTTTTIQFDTTNYPSLTALSANANWHTELVPGAGTGVPTSDLNLGSHVPHWPGYTLIPGGIFTAVSPADNAVIDMSGVGWGISTYQTQAATDDYTVRIIGYPDLPAGPGIINHTGCLLRGQVATGPQTGYLVDMVHDGGTNSKRVIISRVVNNVITEAVFTGADFAETDDTQPKIIEATCTGTVISWAVYDIPILSPLLQLTSGSHDTAGDATRYETGLYRGFDLSRAQAVANSQPFVAGFEIEE